MSIDLSKAKAISDQYGAWKQLADASGRVLWKKKPSTATLTITPYNDWGKYIIDGTTYSGTSTITLEVPIGTVVTCKMCTEDSYTSSSRPYVTVNGTKVFTGSSGVDYPTYNYTVVGNAILVSNRGDGSGNRYGYINITEIRNDPATVTLQVSSSSDGNAKGSDVYFRINADVAPMPNVPQYVVNPYTMDGGSDETLTISVPAGTIINCKARGSGSVKLNGANVGVTTYDYTVTGDATLYMSVKYDYGNGTYANITITET